MTQTGDTGALTEGDSCAHHRVIVDHLRAACFLVAVDVLLSNTGCSYALHRILRRAMRHAYRLGTEEPLLWRLVPALLGEMGPAYPQLDDTRELAEDTPRGEEERFRSMLDRGLGHLETEMAKLDDGQPLPGEVAFRLFDTYGFPADLTEDALRERWRTLDIDSNRRGRIRAIHSPPLLLHEALRGRLGEHVEQCGALADGDWLRFDFAQRDPVDAADLAEIEAEFNRQIRGITQVAA